ncbi:UNVERIFIED_CONTAM: hypothetical protein H355_013027, partial [Colinus virginianus]
MIMSVNLTGPLPAPYKLLYSFENTTQELKHLLSPQQAPERLLQLAQENLDTLVTEMDDLLTRATKVTADGEQTKQDAERTNERARSLGQFMKGILQAAEAVNEDAIRLNETLGTPDKNLEKSLPELQSEADRIVSEMRNKKLNMQERIAQDEFKYLRVSHMSFCQYVEDIADKIQSMSDQLKDKIDDLSQEIQDKMLQEKVLQAENRAAQLNESSAVLD